MSTFPKLFKLPVIPLELVISSLSTVELLELSRCSTKSKQFLKKLLLKENAVQLVFSTEHRDEVYCSVGKFLIRPKFKIRVQKMGGSIPEECEFQQFLGWNFRMRKTDNEVQIIVPSNALQLAGWFTDYLFDVFNVKTSNFFICLHMNSTDLPAYKQWEGSKKALGYWKESGLMDSATFGEYLQWSCRGNSKRSLKCLGKISDPENISPAHFPPMYRLEMFSYITPEAFFSLDVSILKLIPPFTPSLLTPEHFNMFLKKWLENVNFHKNLELFLTCPHYRKGLPENVVLKDIPLLRPRRASLSMRQREDLMDGQIEMINEAWAKPIRRAADGKMATIILNEDYFIFLVN